ncbi:hypothetical protein COU57_00855 [Candidatus Pacearchaeota archaeon CG10_big_fil_rev_8_21_14_0_10_32_14]|nr:MAG: hypothetical protein COU57_00855 [Candidatus Pacearchaeota archaeon CG10_big_fil_rev_8_21_14_0_10_32_14]
MPSLLICGEFLKNLMETKSILLTGASGKLGQSIINSKLFDHLLTPSRDELDITNTESVRKYFNKNKFEMIIHCAALARMVLCEQNPSLAIRTNIIGTSNLVNHLYENKLESKVRVVHISTDGVYQGTDGNYSEQDPTIPYNIYGLTKLAAEFPVSVLPNHVIIRTRFFDPADARFNDYADDIYTSKIPISDLVEAIKTLSISDYIGVINVGDKKMSEYERHKLYQPQIIKSSYEKIQSQSKVKLAKDASMNISLWERIKNEKKKH